MDAVFGGSGLGQRKPAPRRGSIGGERIVDPYDRAPFAGGSVSAVDSTDREKSAVN